MARKETFSVAKNINLAGLSPVTTPTEEESEKTASFESERETVREELKAAPAPVEEKPQPVVEPVQRSEEAGSVDMSTPVILKKKVKETRSVQKSLLLTPSLDKQIKAVSAELGMTQNDFINEVLTQVLANR